MLVRSAPFRRGKCCPFFPFCVFCVWSGVFCRFLPFFSSKGRFLKKFSGANLCFWMVVLVLCFLVGFCLCFCFFFGGLLPKVSEKNSLDVRSGVFWGLFPRAPYMCHMALDVPYGTRCAIWHCFFAHLEPFGTSSYGNPLVTIWHI